MPLIKYQPLGNSKYKYKFSKIDNNTLKCELYLVTGEIDWASVQGEKPRENPAVVTTLVDTREYTKADFPLPNKPHRLYGISQRDGKLQNVLESWTLTQEKKETRLQRELQFNENFTSVVSIYTPDSLDGTDIFSDNVLIAFADNKDEPTLASEYEGELGEQLADVPVLYFSDPEFGPNYFNLFPKVTISSPDSVTAGETLEVVLTMSKAVRKTEKTQFDIWCSCGVPNKQRVFLADGESTTVLVDTAGLTSSDVINFKVNFYNYTSFPEKTIQVD